jgi:nucleolin
MASAKKSKTEAPGSDAGKKNLFVGQLSWNVDEEWLTREFESYGELSSVRIITDKNTGRSKG